MSPSAYLPEQFLPVMVFLLLVVAVGVGLLALGRFLRRRAPSSEKPGPDGPKTPPSPEVPQKLSIRDYIIAMLFLIFIIEAMLLLPWAVASDALGLYGFIEMVIFVAILLVGYCYAWKKGALDSD